jgi:hypothetical protein
MTYERVHSNAVIQTNVDICLFLPFIILTCIFYGDEYADGV